MCILMPIVIVQYIMKKKHVDLMSIVVYINYQFQDRAKDERQQIS